MPYDQSYLNPVYKVQPRLVQGDSPSPFQFPSPSSFYSSIVILLLCRCTSSPDLSTFPPPTHKCNSSSPPHGPKFSPHGPRFSSRWTKIFLHMDQDFSLHNVESTWTFSPHGPRFSSTWTTICSLCGPRFFLNMKSDDWKPLGIFTKTDKCNRYMPLPSMAHPSNHNLCSDASPNLSSVSQDAHVGMWISLKIFHLTHSLQYPSVLK